MDEEINVFLVGNPNVGKSVIFNYLTGVNAIVSNYPGTTVSITSGRTRYRNIRLKIIDLPGIYSLSGTAADHMVVRKALMESQKGFILNIIDSTNMERDLYLTLQLLELDIPMVIILNMADELKSRGITINTEELSNILGVPVVLASGIQGWGISKAVKLGVEEYKRYLRERAHRGSPEGHREGYRVRYGLCRFYDETINVLISTIAHKLRGICKKIGLNGRALAVGIIEKDPTLREMLSKEYPELLSTIEKLIERYEKSMNIDSFYYLIEMRRKFTREVVRQVMKKMKREELRREKIDHYTTYNLFSAYLIMAGVILGLFGAIFFIGGFLEELIGEQLLGALFEQIVAYSEAHWGVGITTLIDGLLTGINAGVSIAIPYVLVFYLILAILEDTGYLTRIAYLVDRLMHKVGLHGRAFIPMIVGLGCNVPAVMGTRIMDTDKERKLSAIMASMVPCSARTVVIIGVVGAFVGFWEAILIYVIVFSLIFLVAKIVSKQIKGGTLGLIMEIPPYRVPRPRNVLIKTWIRVKEFIYIAFPLLLVGSIVISALYHFEVIAPVNAVLSPLTVYILGLPPVLGITLIFGLLRKEMTIEMLAVLVGTTNFIAVLSPAELWVYSLFVTLYFPCIATFEALRREYGTKFASLVAIMQISLALAVAGSAHYIMVMFGWWS